MKTSAFVDPDEIRELFSRTLSRMYRDEVPRYGDLLDIVATINADVLSERSALDGRLCEAGELERLEGERHGAIRLGTAGELAVMRRLFAVMGMQPVGYYDLSAAGVPVHSTGFRPVEAASLRRNPFRVFTSLLRLDLIEDEMLRSRITEILSRREIFTPRCLALIAQAEQEGGLSEALSREFVAEALETFRWHSEATVDIATYQQLAASHPLVADVVCFKGPHINHLTPRVLDIDKAQAAMVERGLRAKEVIEGPPTRDCPILLRQTSFLALEESIRFLGDGAVEGTHTARFGEIEQRGCALTPKGRALYDALLNAHLARPRDAMQPSTLAQAFASFPDDEQTMRKEQLAYFRYAVVRDAPEVPAAIFPSASMEELIEQGWVSAVPMVYEDFLPVSAAGIFRSNLGPGVSARYAAGGRRAAFEAALGRGVLDEFALYEAAQAASWARCIDELTALSLATSNLTA